MHLPTYDMASYVLLVWQDETWLSINYRCFRALFPQHSWARNTPTVYQKAATYAGKMASRINIAKLETHRLLRPVRRSTLMTALAARENKHLATPLISLTAPRRRRCGVPLPRIKITRVSTLTAAMDDMLAMLYKAYRIWYEEIKKALNILIEWCCTVF